MKCKSITLWSLGKHTTVFSAILSVLLNTYPVHLVAQIHPPSNAEVVVPLDSYQDTYRGPRTVERMISIVQSKFSGGEEANWGNSIVKPISHNYTHGHGHEKPINLSNLDHRLPFSNAYLITKRSYFKGKAEYLGVPDTIRQMELSMYAQWLYLELYKLLRWEYLMINYAKVLVLQDDLTPHRLVELFETTIPSKYLSHSPYLQDKHLELVNSFRNQNEKERNEIKEYTRGLVESYYMALAAIDNKKKKVQQRYDKKNVKLKKEMEELNRQETTIKGSAFMQTRAFKKQVAPFANAEALPAQLEIEHATNQYLHDLTTYLEKNTSISDLDQYVTDTGLPNLNKKYLDALSITTSLRFRARILEAFPQAAKQLQTNLEHMIRDHITKIHSFDPSEYIAESNIANRSNFKEYNKFLSMSLKENTLHLIIAEKFPFLIHNAIEHFANMVAVEEAKKRMRWIKYSALMIALFGSTSIGRTKNRYSAWMGNRLVNFYRVLNITGQAYVAGRMGQITYNDLVDLQQIKRSSMTNLEGEGLTSILQAKETFASVVVGGLITGLSVALIYKSSRTFWKQPLVKSKKNNNFFTGVGNTWNGNPTPLKDIGKSSHRNLGKFSRAVIKGDIRSATGHAQAIAGNLGVATGQFVTMPFASLPNLMKKFFAGLFDKAYAGIIFGSVLTVMNSTVQHYLAAAGVNAFVWGFEQMGLPPPAYWQQNSMDKEVLLRRKVFIEYSKILSNSRVQISLLHDTIRKNKKILKGEAAQMSAEEKRELETIIVESQVAIEDILESHLMMWFKFFETREIRNSFFREKGFGMLAVPNAKNPVQLTIFMERIPGDKSSIISYSTSVHRLDDLARRRGIDPNLGMDYKDLLNLAEELKKKRKHINRGELHQQAHSIF